MHLQCTLCNCCDDCASCAQMQCGLCGIALWRVRLVYFFVHTPTVVCTNVQAFASKDNVAWNQYYLTHPSLRHMVNAARAVRGFSHLEDNHVCSSSLWELETDTAEATTQLAIAGC
jgi:hypothetical protein